MLNGTWIQAPEVAAIYAHMTATERRAAALLKCVFGLMFSVPLAIMGHLILSPSSSFGAVIFGFILFFTMTFALRPVLQSWYSYLRRFYCSTTWAKQQGIKPETLRLSRFSSPIADRPHERKSGRSWTTRLVISAAVVLVILIIVRMFFCEAFIVPSDCASPELPSGSRFLAWKMTKTFAARDLIVYRFEGHNNVGRVVRNEGADLIVNRNGEPNAKVAREDVIGKVICVYWRASAAPADSGRNADRVSQTPLETGRSVAPTAAAPDNTIVPATPAVNGGITKSPELQKAQDERYQTLQRAFEVVDARYRNATATPEEHMAALDALLEAQLDADKTKAERIATLERLQRYRRDFEKIILARYQNGTCSEVELHKAHAESLGAEIRLATEKAAGADDRSPAANQEFKVSIRRLQDGRIVAAAKALVIVDAQYGVGRADLVQRAAAADALLEAQLEAAEAKAARIAILQKLLENRVDVEKYMEARLKRGTGLEADWLKAKGDRLAADSRLAKEKAAADADDSSSKSGNPAKPRGSILLYATFGISAPIPKGMTRSELTDKLNAAIDRRLNSGAEKLARVRIRRLDSAEHLGAPVLDNGPIFVEVAVLRPDDADRQRVERLMSQPGTLEFRILANPQKDKQVIESATIDQRVDKKTNATFLALKEEVLDAAGKKLAWWVPVKGSPEPAFYSPGATVNRRKETKDRGLFDEVLVMADSCNVTGEYLTKSRQDWHRRKRSMHQSDIQRCWRKTGRQIDQRPLAGQVGPYFVPFGDHHRRRTLDRASDPQRRFISNQVARLRGTSPRKMRRISPMR